MRLILIRHSKTKPVSNIPIPLWGLTNDGIKEATNLIMNPLVRGIDVMYSSLQTKALETALILSKPNSIPIRTHAGLTEISSFTKKFFGSPGYENNVKAFYTGKVERLLGGETYKEALQRFESALVEIITRESDKSSIGIVSHGNILSFFSARYSEQNPLYFHDVIKMPDIASFDWDRKKFIKLWGER